jgi:hypothetical protein
LTKIEPPCGILSLKQQAQKTLKGVREKKQITYKGKLINITADFSTETLKTRRACSEIFWALNETNFSPRILYPAKLSFKIERAIKIFHNKQILKPYMTTKPPLQKSLQGILHIEDESKQNHKKMGSIKSQEKKRQSESSIDSAAHNPILKQLNDRSHHIPINIKTECQQTQLPHQKTSFSKLVKKEDWTTSCLQETHLIDRNKHWLRVKDEEGLPSQWPPKIGKSSNTYIRQSRLQTYIGQMR